MDEPEMKEFKDVIKLRIVPTTFVFRCSLCGFEDTFYDRHFGLIRMNEHVLEKHADQINPLSKEDLYSRKPDIALEKF